MKNGPVELEDVALVAGTDSGGVMLLVRLSSTNSSCHAIHIPPEVARDLGHQLIDKADWCVRVAHAND